MEDQKLGQELSIRSRMVHHQVEERHQDKELKELENKTITVKQ